MTIGIYCIEHIASGKKYVGKSVRIENRLSWHKYHLTRDNPSRSTNRHLWNAVRKYGWEAFKTYVLQEFASVDEEPIGLAEIEWMDKLKTCDREFGYNLRRDTSTKMVVHPETLVALSEAQKRRYSDVDFGDYEREMTGLRSKRAWSDMPAEKKAALGDVISARLTKYHYAQCDLEGEAFVVWRSLREIKDHYPQIHIPNVHSVADGHKVTYMGFIWEKVDPKRVDPNLLYSGDAPEIDWSQKTSLPRWWVRCIDPDEGEIWVYKSVADAAEAYGVSYAHMSNCINGRVESIHGYLFRKVEPIYISLQKYRRQTKHLIFREDDL